MSKTGPIAPVALWIALALVVPVSWLGNAYYLTQCDFESDYKCEIVHGVGVVVPVAAPITVWSSTDE